MVRRIEIQAIDRIYIATKIKVLEARGEAMVIVFHIEEVHCAVKLVVRAEDGIETSDFVVMNKAQMSFRRHRKKLVAAQIVVTNEDIVFIAWPHGGFHATHESIDGQAMFFLTQLVVKRAFQRPMFGTEGHISAHQLLVVGGIRI